MNNLKEVIESTFYWESNIIKYDFDILKNHINFELIFYEVENNKSKPINYSLIFKEVSSFFFINDCSESRFNFPEREESFNLEITTIVYYPDGVGKISLDSEKSWTKQYNANANFVLEVGGWGAILLIESGIVEINGKVYHTKKLADSSVE